MPQTTQVRAARQIRALHLDGEERLLRKPQVCAMLADPPTTLDTHVEDGLVTPPIRIGPRRIAWPITEVRSIVKARIGGASAEQIRDLVKRLVARRSEHS